MIHKLTQFNEEQFQRMKELMAVLTDSFVLTPQMLREATANSLVYVIEEDGEIRGTATLCIYFTPEGRKAHVEDVVVLPKYQGKGLGRMLMEYVLNECKRFAPITVELTSRPSREVANILYQHLEFELKDTNPYRLEIN